MCILFHTAICGLGLEHFGLSLGLGTAGLDYKSAARKGGKGKGGGEKGGDRKGKEGGTGTPHKKLATGL